MRALITAEEVARVFATGQRRIAAARGQSIVTPAAWSLASELGVVIDQNAEAKAVAESSQAADQGHCERLVDASGVVRVRGTSVRPAKFPAAGAERNVQVADLITGAQGSPMTAGIMSWAREDSFPWKLDYDEVDLVLEGVLHLTIDGRTLDGKAGDTFYIPKGSSVVFGTPWRTKVFYVTYPADWAAGKKG